MIKQTLRTKCVSNSTSISSVLRSVIKCLCIAIKGQNILLERCENVLGKRTATSCDHILKTLVLINQY